MRSLSPKTCRDIRFNNETKTRAVRMRASGEYEYGFWLNGVFTLEGQASSIETALKRVAMHQPVAADHRPAFRK